MTSLKNNLLLAAASLVLTLLLAEAALRWILPARAVPPSKPAGWAIIPEQSWIQYHPTLGWFQKPRFTAALQRGEEKITIKTNSMGMRGEKEYPFDRAAKTPRIAVFGDSFTFGYGVSDHESFPAQMEALLPQSEVLNFGVPGYGTDQIALAYREFSGSFQPDIVILAFYPEDFWRALRAFNDGGYGKPYFTLSPKQELILNHVPVPPGKEFEVPQFPAVIERLWLESALQGSALYRLIHKSWVKGLKLLGLEDPDTQTEWLLGRKILEDTVARIRQTKAKPVLVLIPPHRWISGTDEPLRHSMKRFADRHNIPLIDFTPIFREAAGKTSIDDYYIPGDQHWTPAGCGLAAEILVSEIRKMLQD